MSHAALVESLVLLHGRSRGETGGRWDTSNGSWMPQTRFRCRTVDNPGGTWARKSELGNVSYCVIAGWASCLRR
jgi:hypothetical protein